MSEREEMKTGEPLVPIWQIWGLRLMFAAMVAVLGSRQLTYILEGSTEWEPWRGLGHSMLFSLALLAAVGVFRPLKLLPLMIYEVVWKAVWLTVVAMPPWLQGQPVPAIVSTKGSLIGIALITALIPWRYVWWSYVSQPIERWRPSQKFNQSVSS